MPSKQDNYNNHDIRIGALSHLDIDIRVNVNYVLNSVKDWVEHLRRAGAAEFDLEWNLLYIENLNNDQSEAFWSDFNYNVMSMEWSKDINILNGGCLSIGYNGEEDEQEVFVEMIKYLFDDDECIGQEWGFDCCEERDEFIKKVKDTTE